MASTDDLLKPTTEGLECALGSFHIDPWKPVHTAVITHAHADHARDGHARYICTPETAAILRVRISPKLNIQELEYDTPLDLGSTRITLHPAGHVLGSAQVRIESNTPGSTGGGTWVVTGDYKLDDDGITPPFQHVQCDTFLTESTFGLPIYAWRPQADIARDINAWWRRNRDDRRTSVILAYALGKAQRVLSMLDPSIGPIGLHGAVHKVTEVYRSLDIDLPDTIKANTTTANTLKGAGLIIAPQSAVNGPWIRKFQGINATRTASASGWMTVRGRRRWQALDTGFPLSDHADWPSLLHAISQSACTRLGVTHGYADTLARYARERMGLHAFTVPTRYVGEHDNTEAKVEANTPAAVGDQP